MDLSQLLPEVQEKAQKIVADCKAFGFDLLIYSTLRTFEEQAKLYRQSRTYQEIVNKHNWFIEKGFPELAEILMKVGPCYGANVTGAGPGESWHNYREAFDAVPVINDVAQWNYKGAEDHWDFYVQSIKDNGMFSGVGWGDMPHAQLRPDPNPLLIINRDDILKVLG